MKYQILTILSPFFLIKAVATKIRNVNALWRETRVIGTWDYVFSCTDFIFGKTAYDSIGIAWFIAIFATALVVLDCPPSLILSTERHRTLKIRYLKRLFIRIKYDDVFDVPIFRSSCVGHTHSIPCVWIWLAGGEGLSYHVWIHV